MAEVLQCDRDAANSYLSPAKERTVDGLALAFAAHREAAEKAERQAVVDLIERERTDEQRRSEGNKSTKLGSCAAYAELAFKQTLDLINRCEHRKG